MVNPTTEERNLLRHFLAALAYRTQKALRDASEDFAEFCAAPKVRTPKELVRHMASVLGYATTFFLGGSYRADPLPTFSGEVVRFHNMVGRLAELIAASSAWPDVTPQQFLQGPLADAMTHAGQLAMLRRLAGHPVPPENFVFASITADNLGPNQPAPEAPDHIWPEAP